MVVVVCLFVLFELNANICVAVICKSAILYASFIFVFFLSVMDIWVLVCVGLWSLVFDWFVSRIYQRLEIQFVYSSFSGVEQRRKADDDNDDDDNDGDDDDDVLL